MTLKPLQRDLACWLLAAVALLLIGVTVYRYPGLLQNGKALLAFAGMFIAHRFASAWQASRIVTIPLYKTGERISRTTGEVIRVMEFKKADIPQGTPMSLLSNIETIGTQLQTLVTTFGDPTLLANAENATIIEFLKLRGIGSPTTEQIAAGKKILTDIGQLFADLQAIDASASATTALPVATPAA